MSSAVEKRKRESPQNSGDEGESPSSSDDECTSTVGAMAKRHRGGRLPRLVKLQQEPDPGTMNLKEFRERAKTIKEMIAEIQEQPTQTAADLLKIEALGDLLKKDAPRIVKMELMIEAIQGWNDCHPEAMDSGSESDSKPSKE